VQLFTSAISPLELHNVHIHSKDTNVLYIPSEKILFAGDALEDTLTFIGEPGELSTHLRNLELLNTWGIARIYPNHGDPNIIAEGGYKTTLIDATLDYIKKMRDNVNSDGYLESALESYVGESVEKAWVSVHEAYRAVHSLNLRAIQNHSQGRPVDLLP